MVNFSKSDLSFNSNKTSNPSKDDLNLTHYKARLDYKSPKNATSEVIATTITFFETDIPWIQNYTLTKA
ncbi:hypothetical protein [uncultured Formosa sp.]|uniref:hypothetical protein n=1 Tax=uncultured Formosa sp. TaxID=255435 RepID=UPI0026247B20|nr:hypothetical protein [uncultured Formosa sp.]